MASGRGGQTYHQDYIARIRYSNTLPPPPNPPKLLEIPGAGLADGHYTSAAYASRLIREQPLNIEADAELGMPIDLVGLPGVFEGDESAIYGIDPPPPVHPHDKALLRPLNSLGKSTGSASSVSFLRRTEYVSSEARTRGDAGRRDKADADPRMLKRKRAEDLGQDDPKRMLRDIVKGFDLAYPEDVHRGPETSSQIQGAQPTAQEKAAWKEPQHPSDPTLTMLDAYPILIDFDALPDFGSFIVAKFTQAPVTMSDTYDKRLDTAIFRPIEHGEEKMAKYESMRIEHKANPSRPLPPKQTFDYEFFLPESDETAEKTQVMFDVRKTSQHGDEQYTAEREDSGHKHFRFDRLRTYEHYGKEQMPDDKFNDVVALALHDGVDAKDKGAYVYPIGSRLNLRARRAGQKIAVGVPLEDENSCDVIELGVRDLNEAEKFEIENHKREYMGFAPLEPPAEQDVDEAADDADGA